MIMDFIAFDRHHHQVAHFLFQYAGLPRRASSVKTRQDMLYPAGDYGNNISAQRPDCLDRASAYYVANLMEISEKPVRVLDLGCGIGAWSMRQALFGRNTDIVAVDVA